MDLMLIITPLETNTRTLSRSNTDEPGRLGGNGLERNHRQLQLLREDSCVIKVSAIHAKYADILEKETTKLLSWRSGYTYQFISCLIRRFPSDHSTGKPKRQLQKWRLVISSRNSSQVSAIPAKYADIFEK